MENTSNFDIWQRANGRAAMMIFWAIIANLPFALAHMSKLLVVSIRIYLG